MNRRRLLKVLWVAEFIIGLLPAFTLVCASLVSYVFLIPVFPNLLAGPSNSAALHSFILVSGMVIGGLLGLIGIGLAFRPERLHQNRKLKSTAVFLGCAGILAEGIYVAHEGLSAVASNCFSLWVVAGPLLVGAHCVYRVFLSPTVTVE